MYDLETLRILNERAYLRSLEMVNEGITQTTTPSRPAPVFPLSVMAYKLIVGPPSLIRLIDLMENSDTVAYFLELVREYVPRQEAEIMAALDDSDRIRLFTHHFANQYFPLQEEYEAYDDYTIGDFIRYVPVDLMGFTWDEYEDFNGFRDGFVLLLSMVESPYEEAERVPILERVKELVGKSLAEMIPLEGWDLGDIHRMLDGSEYEGCAAFADWIHANTGCLQLDANYQDYAPEEWSMELIQNLTQQWPQVIDLQGKMDHTYVWLEEDLHRNFKKLLAAMLGIEDESVPKEQMPFPLDEKGQVRKEEVI